MHQSIEIWLNQASDAVLLSSKNQFPNCESNHQYLSWTKGRKYYKVMIGSSSGRKSVYCFINFNGNISKAASFNFPAKGVRGNISDIDPKTITSSTAWLYLR